MCTDRKMSSGPGGVGVGLSLQSTGVRTAHNAVVVQGSQSLGSGKELAGLPVYPPDYHSTAQGVGTCWLLVDHLQLGADET